MGTCYVVFAMVRSRYGPDAAWVALIALMGLPCLVYQGISAQRRHSGPFFGRRSCTRTGAGPGAQPQSCLLMVLAIGLAGAKPRVCRTASSSRCGPCGTSGRTGGYSPGRSCFWAPQRCSAASKRISNRRGSLETRLDRPSLSVTTGIWTAFAAPRRTCRATWRSVYLGPSRVGFAAPATRWIGDAEQDFLTWAGIADAGVGPSLRHKTLYFLQSGFEELSGFGPLGTIAMAAALASAVFWRPRKPWWRLAAVALFGFLVASDTIAYSYWGNRYPYPMVRPGDRGGRMCVVGNRLAARAWRSARDSRHSRLRVWLPRRSSPSTAAPRRSPHHCSIGRPLRPAIFLLSTRCG